VPRHVVTVFPKLLVLPTEGNRRHWEAIIERLGHAYRTTPHPDGDAIEIHFSKRKSRREAKLEVATTLDEIDPRWHRLLRLYPTESALRDLGE
jgi:hypothetical protein